MGIFDFFKKKSTVAQIPKEETRMEKSVQRGVAKSKRIDLNYQNERDIRNCFIAFDVETTGLSPASDRIVELGAVIFRNGTVDGRFSTLVNPGVSISRAATTVNNITDEMLAAAPLEDVVYSQLVEFLGDALCAKVTMCAHNAKFDFDFLCNTLARLGFNADIEYVDTLSLSRKYLRGLDNHKQTTIEAFYGLDKSASHRAAFDAENCGKIMLRLLDAAGSELKAERTKIERSKPKLQELEVCAYIQSLIEQRGGDVDLLRFKKNSSGYVEAYCLYRFLSFKFAQKGSYVLVRSNCIAMGNFYTEACTQSEGGADYTRVYFSTPFDLEALSDYICSVFAKCYKDMEEYASYGNYGIERIKSSIRSLLALSQEEVLSLLNGAREHDYTPVPEVVANESNVPRNSVLVNAVHKRVALSEIRNAEDEEKGFSMGFPYWEKGEEERKNGHFELAIDLFDKARLNGYLAPALYNSYALTYRKLRDYSNEILILDEGIARIPKKSSRWIARRDKAITLLLAQQEAERITEKRKIETQVKKECVKSSSKQPQGRAILQMDDDGNVIKSFDTIAAAEREVGVSSRCIRDAANGVQKRAGGYCWRFIE